MKINACWDAICSTLICCLLAGMAAAQEVQPETPLSRPRPYLYGGLQLDGNGSAVLDYVVGAGIQENTSRFIFDGLGEYSNTRKTDDNTINNHSGRTRLLYGAARYRFANRWFVGGGARWSELSTTNYAKQSWHPFFGGGRDWNCCRFSLDYLWMGAEHVNRQGCPVPNGQCTNGTKGFDFQMFLPSPASHSHVLFRMDFLPIWFHTTVTTTDPALTREQMGETGIGSFVQYTLLFRY